jgi:hypothetical protein
MLWNMPWINCPLCFLLILIKMDTPDQVLKDYRKRKATCLLLLIGNERCTRYSSPATLIFRSSHSFITLSSSALYFLSLVHYIISPTSITLSITSRMFFFVFKLNIIVFSLFLAYFQILSFQMYRYFNN